MSKIPRDHPRYHSLKTREKISDAMKEGLVHSTGLIAHGRGEAFDYLFGEKTNNFADISEKVAACVLLLADDPVISVNGNVVSLSSKDCVILSETIPAKIEVNLFHRTDERIRLLTDRLKSDGSKKVYGLSGDAKITGLSHDRGICDKDGIFSSDLVLVPLEDGDRCKALKDMGKKVITIDLNPLSRTAKTADITIVDNIIRAIPNIIKWAKDLKEKDGEYLREIIDSYDNEKNLKESLDFISKRLNSLD